MNDKSHSGSLFYLMQLSPLFTHSGNNIAITPSLEGKSSIVLFLSISCFRRSEKPSHNLSYVIVEASNELDISNLVPNIKNDTPSTFEKSRIYNQNKNTGQLELAPNAQQIYNNYKKSIQLKGIQWKN